MFIKSLAATAALALMASSAMAAETPRTKSDTGAKLGNEVRRTKVDTDVKGPAETPRTKVDAGKTGSETRTAAARGR